MARFASTVPRLVTLTTILLAAATGLGFLGRFHWLCDLFAHFPIQLGVGLLCCAAAAWIMGRRRVAYFAVAAALSNVAIALPQLLYWPTAEARDGGAIRLVHANVNHYNRDFEDAVEFFRETDPDILLVSEVDSDWRASLDSLKQTLPHVFHAHGARKFGMTLMSRYPMTAEAVSFVRNNVSIVALVDVDGRRLRVIGAHPYSPVSSRRTRSRNRQLEAIAGRVRTYAEPTIVLGDLNTTPWSHAFRAFVSDSGLRDSSRGVGYQWSWPAPYWPLALPIDHCLVSDGVRVLDRRMGPHIGSDHLPLSVDVSFEADGDREARFVSRSRL